MQIISVTSVENTTTSKSSRGFVLACFIFSTLFFYGSTGKNIAPIVNILSPFLLFLFYISTKGKIKRTLYRLSAFTIISILISFLLIGGGWGSLASNIGIVLLIYLFCNCKLTNSESLYFTKCLREFHIFLLLFVTILGYNEGYIGSFNSNSVANQALIDMTFFMLVPHRRKIIQILLIVSSVAVIIYMNSRTCMGACLLVGTIWLFRSFIQKRPVILKISFWAVITLSVAIPFAYSQILGDAAQVDDINAVSAENFGKNIFTGREIIWAAAWSQLQKTPENILFGVGSHFDFDGRDDLGSNFHSSFFTVVICCGYIGFLLISILLYKLFIKDIKYFSLHNSDVLYEKMCYIPIMFSGIFESTLLVGNFAIMLYFMLCMINSKKDKEYYLL